MRAHGFTADQLAMVVHIGFAAQTAERVVGTFGQTSEIKIHRRRRASAWVSPRDWFRGVSAARLRARAKRRPASARASVRFPPERRPYTL